MMLDSKRREGVPEWRGFLATAVESLTPVIFQGTGACVVAGEESGQVYCFTGQDPEQMIDAKDADALLRSGLFRMKS